MLPSEIMQKRGFVQWVLEDRDGKVCIGGALHIYLAEGAPFWREDNDAISLMQPLLIAVCRAIGIVDITKSEDLWKAMVDWNNKPERMQSEVVKVLQSAEKRLGLV